MNTDNFVNLSGQDFLQNIRPLVYLWQRGSETLYVGQSSKGVARLFTHDKINVLCEVLPTDRFTIYYVESPMEAVLLERELIKALQPRFNIIGREFVLSNGLWRNRYGNE